MAARTPVPGFAAALVLLALAVGFASCAETEEDTSQVATEGPTPTKVLQMPTPTVPAVTSPPARTPGPGETVWRWGDVTLIVPDKSGISVGRTTFGKVEHPPDGGPVVTLTRGESGVTIDALTGQVVMDNRQAADRLEFDDVLNTIRVITPAERLPIAWPYGTNAPSTEKKQGGNLRFLDPDPSTGLVVRIVSRQFEGGGDEVMILENVRSRRFIDVATGYVIASNDQIAPEDAPAFERWTDSIEVSAP